MIELLPDSARPPLEEALAGYRLHGCARLGPVLGEGALALLRDRCDSILRGDTDRNGLFFQADSATGRYEDLPRGMGWQGPSFAYRKVEKLERDPLFREFLENDLFRRIAQAVHDGPLALCRAALFNKSAAGGTRLPWHQDGGSFWGLSRDPVLQIWTALDDTPVEAGCVEVVPGSHARLATPLGGVIPDDVAERAGAASRAVEFPARAGEGLLLHNYVWHRSGLNRSGRPRRALTVCYMSAETRCTRTKRAPRQFPRVFE
jgi:hypothetical protein